MRPGTDTPLTIEQVRAVLEAFKRSVELEGEVRVAALDALCGEDRAVRNRVERMLARESHPGGAAFLSIGWQGRGGERV